MSIVENCFNFEKIDLKLNFDFIIKSQNLAEL